MDVNLQTFDVIVVGAGPAGATAAFYLAQESRQQGRSLAVGLLEKARFPRDKYCGDAWCAPALDILEDMGVLQALVAEGLVQDTTSGGFVSPSGENYMTRAGGEAEISQKNRTFAIKRMICDERIARRAAEVGADLIEEAAVESAQLQEDGYWLLSCGDGRQFRCRLLLAADGATSRLARSLGVVTSAPNAAAARQYVKGGTHNFQAGGVLLFPEYILPGYVALFRHYNDDIDLGAYIIPGGAAGVEEAASIYEAQILKDPFIQRVLGPTVEFLEPVRTASLRMGGEPQTTARQFMVVGDAAGQTDPLTGEGIHTAMIAARLAARRALEMFAENTFDTAASAVYHQRWMAAFGKDFGSSALSAKMSYRYPFFLDAAARLAENTAGRFMETFGAIMTGVEPKSAYAKPDVALPLMAELGRQFWQQKILRRAHGMAAYRQRAEENPLRTSSFAAVCLRDAHVTASATAAAWAQQAQGQKPQSLRFASDAADARPLLVLYASEYGYSKGVAQQLAEQLSERTLNGSPLSPRVLAMDAWQRINWEKETLAFVICPTSGDGDFPLQAREFVQALEDGLKLPALRYALLACGDSAYPNFCQAGHDLHELLQLAGAQALLDIMEVDQEDEAVVADWLAEVDALFTDDFELNLVDGTGDYLLAGADTDTADGAAQVSAKRPLSATLLERHCLTTAGPADEETQEVLSLTLALYEHDAEDTQQTRRLDWQPGDALGVLPHNAAALVEEILSHMSVTGDTILGVFSQIMTLREGLTRHLDIKTLSRNRLLKFAGWITDAEEQQRWQTLITAAGSMDAAAKNYVEGRELIDLLADFPTTARQLDSVQWMGFLPRLQPRYYSIASSPLVHADQITLCVARLRYDSHGKARAGVASNYLGHDLLVGSRCAVFLQANPAFRPPPLSAPVGPVMIGPGTGVAPFRGFMQHLQQEARNAGQRLEDIWPNEAAPALFFGCRRPQQDFLYHELWQNWQAAGCLLLFTAFSRQQAEKIHVQQRLREQAALIWQRFEQGATFYICGDAKHMAGEVEQVLLEIIAGQGQKTAEEARAYLNAAARAGHLLKDVWA